MSDFTVNDSAYCKSLAICISANVNNEKLSDADFRQFVRSSVPEYEKHNNDNDKPRNILSTRG